VFHEDILEAIFKRRKVGFRANAGQACFNGMFNDIELVAPIFKHKGTKTRYFRGAVRVMTDTLQDCNGVVTPGTGARCYGAVDENRRGSRRCRASGRAGTHRMTMCRDSMNGHYQPPVGLSNSSCGCFLDSCTPAAAVDPGPRERADFGQSSNRPADAASRP